MPLSVQNKAKIVGVLNAMDVYYSVNDGAVPHSQTAFPARQKSVLPRRAADAIFYRAANGSQTTLPYTVIRNHNDGLNPYALVVNDAPPVHARNSNERDPSRGTFGEVYPVKLVQLTYNGSEYTEAQSTDAADAILYKRVTYVDLDQYAALNALGDGKPLGVVSRSHVEAEYHFIKTFLPAATNEYASTGWPIVYDVTSEDVVFSGNPITFKTALVPMRKTGDVNLTEFLQQRGSPGRPSLTAVQKFQMICDAFTALRTVHDGGCFHSDIKPDNIRVNNDGSGLTLVDFGGSRPLTDTYNGHAGTRHYTAPEATGAMGVRDKGMRAGFPPTRE